MNFAQDVTFANEYAWERCIPVIGTGEVKPARQREQALERWAAPALAVLGLQGG